MGGSGSCRPVAALCGRGLPAEGPPLGRALHASTVRRQVQATARRLEDELEVIAGKAVPAQGRASCFGYVQTYDTKPKRRLCEVLTAQGMAANQQVTFLTDGGADIRDLPRYLNPQAEHLLDWFPITRRITVMTTMAKSLRPPPADPDLELTTEAATTLINEVRADLQRLTWFLWHGTVFRALNTVKGITIDLETPHPNEGPSDSPNKLLKAQCSGPCHQPQSRAFSQVRRLGLMPLSVARLVSGLISGAPLTRNDGPVWGW
ncbi:MAG: hypothetical protein ACRDQ4_27965 [Pseudonocardiaceae bacterium]